jgi:hypothetical protein
MTGTNWNERQRKVMGYYLVDIQILNHASIADLRRAEGKKSDGSDDERPKKKSNGKAKSRRK